MRAAEVHRIIRQRIDPIASELGFRRDRGATSVWRRRYDENSDLLMVFDLRGKPWLPISGNGFLGEFEKTESPGESYGGYGPRMLFGELMTDTELGERLRLHNEWLARALQRYRELSRLTSDLSPEERAERLAYAADRPLYEKSLRPIDNPRYIRDELFQFYDEADVLTWANFCALHVEAWLEQFIKSLDA